MLNGINEEGLSDDRYKIKVKNHSGATEDICDFLNGRQRKTFVTFSNLKYAKNRI